MTTRTFKNKEADDHLGLIQLGSDLTLIFDGYFGATPKTVNFIYHENMVTNTINIVDATTGKALTTEKVTGQEGT